MSKNTEEKSPIERYFEIYNTSDGYAFPWLDDSGHNSGSIEAKPARFTRQDLERILSTKFHLLSRLGDDDRGIAIYCVWSNGYKQFLPLDNFEISVRLKSDLGGK